MKIAILGTRGIPANYGGFETFAQECSIRLVSRGHDVTVYGRSHHVPPHLERWNGVRIVVLPTIRWKYTDTVVHSLLSVFHALPRRYDVILLCNAANSAFAWIPRILGVPVAVNVDGIERRRRKWSLLGQTYYRVSETLSVWFSSAIVTDARVIQDYYRNRHKADSFFIPYGASTEPPEGDEALARLGLSPRGYFLYVSRLEPENNAHVVLEAFGRVRSERRLVIVGDAPYSRDYIARLHRTRDTRVVFTGAIYGREYFELQANAHCYIHATEVGGTHPALLEAMGQGGLVVANETPENKEVLGGKGLLYERNSPDALARVLQSVESEPARYEALRSEARNRVEQQYSWDRVVDQYEELFRTLVRNN